MSFPPILSAPSRTECISAECLINIVLYSNMEICTFSSKDCPEINGTKSIGKKLFIKSCLILLKLSGKCGQ